MSHPVANTVVTPAKPNYFKRLLSNMRRRPALYLMSLPAFVLIIIFSYVPMAGVLMAFQDYSVEGGLFGSAWIGFENFKLFFNSYYAKNVILNTFLISLYSLGVGFLMPIIFSLLVNTIKVKWAGKFIKTVSYIPYFISTVIMVSLITDFFNVHTGIVNKALGLFNIPPKDFLNEANVFYSLFVWTDLWQAMGWSSIIYLSVLGGVPQDLYDAAKLDGANKMKVLRFIELPQLYPTVSVLLVLALGSLLSVGFEKIFLLQTPLNSGRSEVISTYVYKLGVLAQDYGFGTAVGLFNSVVSFVLLVLANLLVRRISDYSLW
ncbi:ABC transporter permease [Clostridia bacterium]|nr:ABC transporter permease [Clostridia bacterium]